MVPIAVATSVLEIATAALLRYQIAKSVLVRSCV